jgi:DNA-directed RNA polymerase specialized sigma24 family protein
VSPRVPAPSSPATHFASADVRTAIASALRRRHVGRSDLDDLTQEVLVKALALRESPTTLSECVALARKMASDLAVDRMRQRRIRSRFLDGPCEHPDDTAAADTPASDLPETIDVQRQLDFARRQLEAGVITVRQAAMFESEADDVPQRETARRLHIAYSTLRNELARGRRAMRESWTAYAAMALFAIMGWLTYLLGDRPHLTLEATDAPDLHLDHTVTPPEPTPEETAEALRRQALRACAAQQWYDCVETLDRAAEIDPAGDTKPWVHEARKKAMGHLDPK